MVILIIHTALTSRNYKVNDKKEHQWSFKYQVAPLTSALIVFKKYVMNLLKSM